MEKLRKEVKAKILKSILNKISDISLTFSQVNRDLPMKKAITENKLDELIDLYKMMIIDFINYLKTTEYGKENKNSTT